MTREWKKSVKEGLVAFSIIFSITCLLLLLFELFAYYSYQKLPMLAGVANTGSVENVEIDARINSPTYPDKGYARSVFGDYATLETEYRPFTVFSHKEIKTGTINIDGNGIRKTCYVRKPGGIEKPTKIFMFGGSTIWGVGVDDCNTIPSLLHKRLQEDFPARTFAITNFGALGYVSTQELIQLMLELQKGNVPDYVVFYDGINDTHAAGFRPGIPGYHQHYHTTKNILGGGLLSNILYSTYSVKLLSSLTERFYKRQSDSVLADIDMKAGQVADIYKNNIVILDQLAKQYRFEYFAFWQPMLLTSNKPVTDYEQHHIDKSANLVVIANKVYDAIKATNFTGLGFYNISGVFDAVGKDIFLDTAHLGPTGNKIIMETMYKTIKPALK